MPNNYSLRQSNPQAIPDGRKQTGAKHASMKTIQRLIDDTQREKDTLTSRNTEAGSIPIKCQLDEELRRRQLAFKKTAQCKTHTAPGTSSTAPPPATPRRSPQNTLLQFSRPNTLMFVQADTFNEMLAHAMEAPKHWVPEKFMEERSKPDHIDQQELCAGVTHPDTGETITSNR